MRYSVTASAYLNLHTIVIARSKAEAIEKALDRGIQLIFWDTACENPNQWRIADSPDEIITDTIECEVTDE